MQQLNIQDISMLLMESPTSPQHVGGLQILRKPEGAHKDYARRLYQRWVRVPVRTAPFNYRLLETVHERLAKLPASKLPGVKQLVQTLGKAYFWEILEDVDVSEHLHLHTLAHPGSTAQLLELVSRLHGRMLDRSRPLWEQHIIDGLPGDRFAFYSKLHHALLDGKRAMAIAQLSTSSNPRRRNLPPGWAVDQDALQAIIARRVANAQPDMDVQSLHLWFETVRTLGADWVRSRVRRPGSGVIAPYSAPESILNRPLSARRSIAMCSLPLRTIEAVGSAAGATVNEVLLGCCAGALHRYLQQRKALPRAPLIAGVAAAIARTDNAVSGNVVGQILVSLATERRDPWARLEAVMESSRAAKSHMRSMPVEVFRRYGLASVLPVVLLGYTPVGHRVLNANVGVSNVPGPREPLYINGALIEGTFSASVLLQGLALNITATNIGPNLDVGFTACPDVVDDVQQLAGYLGEELGELARIARRKRTSVGAGSPRARRGSTASRKATAGASSKTPAR